MNNWNLKLIYNDITNWEEDFNTLEEDFNKIKEYNGKLNDKDLLLECLKCKTQIEEKIVKLFVYASSNYDLNQKDLTNQGYFSRVYSKFNQYQQTISYLEPQLIENSKDILEYLKDDSFEDYRVSLNKLFDTQKYVLDEKSESIIATMSEALQEYGHLYDSLTTIDKETDSLVKLSTKETINVNIANFTTYLGKLKNANDRKKVFEAIYKYYAAHKETLAGIYKGIMGSELAQMKLRGYNSILESHLTPKNIDKDVFLSLINTARTKNKPLKRYYKLRKKHLHLGSLHTYDRFMKFKDSKEVYPYEKVREMVLESAKSLGDDYYNHAKKVLEDGRVSVYPADGKRTGAYSTGLYKEGPFILLNHTDSLNDAFTVAHEAGHSIHTLYANENQNIIDADYEIFVAEIASTFNEQVFLDYILKNTTDKDEQIVILQESIDSLIATFYRQALFANYEYLAHQLIEKNEVINSEVLSKIMIDLYKDYYGIDIKKEKYKELVWAYIPHLFRSPFYVYQYATSYSASLAIFENVKNGKENAFSDYIKMLSSGGSKYPIDIVKIAGIDLTNKKPFEAVVNRLDELVTKLENLLEEE